MYDEKHEVKNVSLHTLDNDCLSNSLHGQRCLKSQIIFEQLKVFGDSKNIDFIEKKFNINRPYYLEINMDSICHAIKSFLGFRMCRNYPLLFELLIGHSSIEEIYYSREEDEQIKIEIREELNKNSIQERERVINNFFEKASETWDGSIQISLKYTKIILEFLNLYKVGEIEAFFTFIYYDKYRRRIDFSSGEQVVIFYLSKIKSLKSSLLIIDEIDVYLHPKWQKDFFSILIQYLDLTKSKIKHLILTTHSPFLLSDIPKQNIIFLDKDEKGNCKVVDGLKEKKQTFGANIHTLLSDSFFMENGLMGEFAKSKIDRAIELLNQEQLNEDELKYCEQIISIIGEPIVKNQLQRMLDSKRLKKVDEIDAIKKSMIAMKQRLDELEK
jgi:predicted ATPase